MEFRDLTFSNLNIFNNDILQVRFYFLFWLSMFSSAYVITFVVVMSVD